MQFAGTRDIEKSNEVSMLSVLMCGGSILVYVAMLALSGVGIGVVASYDIPLTSVDSPTYS